VAALYNGGKSSLGAKKDAEALARFLRIEKEFRGSSLRRRRALSRRESFIRIAGELAEFLKMMTTLPDDYPKGDMRTEALFRAAMQHMLSGDPVAADTLLGRASVMEWETITGRQLDASRTSARG